LQGCIASHQGNYENATLLLAKAEKNEIDLGYGEPPLYARPMAYSIAQLKRFPKSAMVYFELLKNYNQKGDAEKAKEMENKLKEACLYADKGMYALKKK
jgi:hypothetical protein